MDTGMTQEERLRRMEFALLNLAQYARPIPIPIGVCYNAACGAPYHPHWDHESDGYINWKGPIINE